MKHLPVLLTVPAIMGLSLVFRADPRGPEAASPPAAPAPSPADPGFRAAAHEAPPPAKKADKEEPPLAARVSLGCGNTLLTKAREAEGATTIVLVEMAVEQFRLCLRYESQAPACREWFADVHLQLEQAKGLLARLDPQRATKELAGQADGREDEDRPRRPETLPSPQESAPPAADPAPAARTPVVAKSVEPLMVGPDGVIYHRVGQGGR
jgi:hypothetical protein